MTTGQLIAQLKQKFDYQTAADLYEQIGDNDFFKRMFRLGPTVFNTKKLKDWLNTLEEKAAVMSTATPITAPAVASPRIEQYRNAPDEVKAVIGARQAAYREKDFLFSQLEYYKTDLERKEAGKKIKELCDKIDQAWAALKYWEVNKKLPEAKIEKDPEHDISDPVDLHKRLVALRANISRDRKIAEAADTPEAWAKVHKWERKLKIVTDKLNPIPPQ